MMLRDDSRQEISCPCNTEQDEIWNFLIFEDTQYKHKQ